MMVESEAKELTEEEMLGAVVFAHNESRKVIGAIIELAEKAAKDPGKSTCRTTPPTSRRSSRRVGRRYRRGLQADRQVGPLERAERRARQGQDAVCG
jgi:polyribonucleotide nucleotidyltransferase